MRYKRALDKRQIKLLIKNSSLSNQELSKKLKISPELVGTYKSRLRKQGFDIPKHVKKTTKKIVKEIKKELNKKKE